MGLACSSRAGSSAQASATAPVFQVGAFFLAGPRPAWGLKMLADCRELEL